MMKPIVETNRKQGKGALICICSAHEDVLTAAFSFLKKHPDAALSIESTVQQVNQDGGYTGMKPADFTAKVRSLAGAYGVADSAYILAGDHLGPNAWKHLPAAEAMGKSLTLITDCVRAGYTKLHIDPSMACADDPKPLPVPTIAARTAQMIRAAEEAATQAFGSSQKLFYVVGTEVPVPGGAQEFEDHVSITPLSEVNQTIALIQGAMAKEGMASVWQRVHGLVVQPGVEFGDEFVAPYKDASGLFEALKPHPTLAYEAHSTDYQTPSALKALVNHHFAILKVGPELTFAWREALFALDAILHERSPGEPSLRSFVQSQMEANPMYWEAYYKGSPAELAYKRIFSLSDRIRYYWAQPAIAEAVAKTLPKLSAPLNYALISQYLPWLLDCTEQRDGFSAQDILILAVERIIHKYYQACQG